MVKFGMIEEVIEDMKSGVFDFTENDACSNCGSCCADLLPVGEEEIIEIKKYVKQNGIKEQKRLFPFAQQPAVDMVCPFRSEAERKCVIYPVRPAICKDFRCDNPKKGIRASKELYEKKLRIISMRDTFFGGAK